MADLEIKSVPETAAEFGYHPQSWRRLVRQGKVKPPRRLGSGCKNFYTAQDRQEIADMGIKGVPNG